MSNWKPKTNPVILEEGVSRWPYFLFVAVVYGIILVAVLVTAL